MLLTYEGRGYQLRGDRVPRPGIPGGAMSDWLAAAAPGSAMTIGCPAGDCFYTPGLEWAPLLFAGTGTGIAPPIAIVRSALAGGHTVPITIIHGAADPGGLYLGSGRPAALSGDGPPATPGHGQLEPRRPFDHVAQRLCCPGGEEIADTALQEAARLREFPGTLRAFLCGGPGSVHRMRRAVPRRDPARRHPRRQVCRCRGFLAAASRPRLTPVSP
jgi:CDP-4-dehydro-6-deoxyglucose reductase, E3